MMYGTKGQQLSLWCGPTFMLLFFIGFWVCAGFVPPPSPMSSGADIATLFHDRTTGIRLGMVIAMASAGLLTPWVGLITEQMLRMRSVSPSLAYAQLGAGCTAILLFVLPTLLWEVAAFRPTRDPQLILLLDDLAWVIFIVPFSLPVVQGIVIAAAIFLDDTKPAVFPRWVAYFNIWVAILFIPGAVAVFFKTGPFAWNGLFAWWLPFIVFGAWFGVMFFVLKNAITQQVRASP